MKATAGLKYVKRRKGNTEIIPAIKDHKRTIIMDTTEKANILNSYYASVFRCERNSHLQANGTSYSRVFEASLG
jgi:hypothetical protein